MNFFTFKMYVTLRNVSIASSHHEHDLRLPHLCSSESQLPSLVTKIIQKDFSWMQQNTCAKDQ